LGEVFTLSKTDADADGNSLALAHSEASLWLQAYCTSNAEAYSRACSFTEAKGKVNVDTTTTGGLTTVSLKIKLEAASTSYAFARSSALAKSYTDIAAQSYTDVVAYCNSIGNKSPVCAKGTARTDLAVVANATARAFSDAVSESESEGFGKARAAVYVEGSSINTVSSFLTATAKAWTMASADTSVKAVAKVATEIINESFTKVCISRHEAICKKGSDNYGKGVCKTSPLKACASAYAYGEAIGDALSTGIAESFVEANAESSTVAILKADVDLKTTPQFKWKTTRGGAEVSCPK
jgi:virulence-associated protein VapD